MVDDLFEVSEDGAVVVRLHVQPGAGRTSVVGRHGDALKVKVAAPPEQGRANDACAALLADVTGVKAGQIELVSGASSRSKRFRVDGIEAAEFRSRLEVALVASPLGGRTGGNARGRRGVPGRP
jgi:uncharacterized protein